MGELSNGPIPKLPRTPNQGFANLAPQIEHVIGVVEQPDHHSGDDLVLTNVAIS